MLQFLSFFIEPLHIICFYILFCTQNWQYIREVRSNKFIKLAISVITLVVIQVIIELGLIPILWLFFLCTNVATILFLIVITYLCLRRHANSDLTLRINVLLSMDIFIAIQIFCAFLDKSLMVICRNITVVHPMLVVVIIHNIIEAALSFFMGIISARLYKLIKKLTGKFIAL